ncbi:hypothetical protein GMRT_13214 [Giardia muris]|uniref:Uncharacterized protein n=1 Tax=Giardia muris TaxID=5742 RepID=A0A4Z1T6C5_GIAMU|nr:hypothetical protein GMRT_13214 [Giardia muris]|eukprot:TNJ28687.1 hypothetical protein GMRT_13214 [Giardia muris]
MTDWKDRTEAYFAAAKALSPRPYVKVDSLTICEATRVAQHNDQGLDCIPELRLKAPRLQLHELLTEIPPEHVVYGLLLDMHCMFQSMSPLTFFYHGVVERAVELLRELPRGESINLLAYIRAHHQLSDSQLYTLFAAYSLILALVLLSLHRQQLGLTFCKHGEDFNLDIFAFADYIGAPGIESLFRDEYTATFPYGVFLEVLGLSKTPPAYYLTSLAVLIRFCNIGIFNKADPKTLLTLVGDLHDLYRPFGSKDVAWIRSIENDRFFSDYFLVERYHSKRYAARLACHVECRTLVRKDKPKLYVPNDIAEVLLSAHNYMHAILQTVGQPRGPNVFKDSFYCSSLIHVCKKHVSMFERLSLTYNDVAGPLRLQFTEYTRRLLKKVPQPAVRLTINIVEMLAHSLADMHSCVALCNIKKLDRVIRKFLFMHFNVWFSELEKARGEVVMSFGGDLKAAETYYSRIIVFLELIYIEVGLLPAYQLFQRNGLLCKAEEPVYWLIMCRLSERAIEIYEKALEVDLECLQRLEEYEDEDYVGEADSMRSLDLVYAMHHRRYEECRANLCACVADPEALKAIQVTQMEEENLLQLYSRHKLVGVASLHIPGFLGMDLQGYDLVRALIEGEYPKRRRCPKRIWLERALKEYSSPLASFTIPQTKYYRGLLCDWIP